MLKAIWTSNENIATKVIATAGVPVTYIALGALAIVGTVCGVVKDEVNGVKDIINGRN